MIEIFYNWIVEAVANLISIIDRAKKQVNFMVYKLCFNKAVKIKKEY